MPLYQYECINNHRFESSRSIEDRHNSLCPICGKLGKLVMSLPNMRIAEPIKFFSSDGKELGWKADGGISPPEGQPYPVGG